MSLRVTCPHQNIEVVEDRVYFSILRRTPQSSNFVTYFTIEQDPKYAYAAFFDDFGPPSILQLTEFYRYLVNSINDVENEMKQKQGKTKLNIFQANNNTAKSFHQSIVQSAIRLLHFYTSPNPISCANAVMYISFFRMIYLNLTAEEAFKPFKPITKYIYDYRDASTAPSIFELKIIDVLRGIKHAMELKWYDPFTFDSAKWDHHQQIKNGDMNWLIPNKLLAFASPYSMSVLPSGDVVATPETVIPTFKEFGITRIVRLNKKYYDAELFINEGFQFTELYFLDGSIPPPNILQTWLSIIETDGEVVALHCKAGLGRTGTLAGCYLIKEFGFTAPEAIAWIRVCRGGSIIGPQQLYLVNYEEDMKMNNQRDEELKLTTSRNEPVEPIAETTTTEKVPDLNIAGMMPIPAPPPPAKSSRILFVPFKGCPLRYDDDDDDSSYNFRPKTARSKNASRKRNALPTTNFGGRSSNTPARAPRRTSKQSQNRAYMMNALPISAIHPQPRKVAQKQPYWKTIGAYA